MGERGREGEEFRMQVRGREEGKAVPARIQTSATALVSPLRADALVGACSRAASEVPGFSSSPSSETPLLT